MSSVRPCSRATLNLESIAFACVPVTRAEVHTLIHHAPRRSHRGAMDELRGRFGDTLAWNRVGRGCPLLAKSPMKPAWIALRRPVRS